MVNIMRSGRRWLDTGKAGQRVCDVSYIPGHDMTILSEKGLVTTKSAYAT